MTIDRYALELSLVGPWHPFDPANPLPGDEYEPIRAQLREAGLLVAPPQPNARLVLCATLIEAAENPDATDPPMVASLLIHEHTGGPQVTVQLTEVGAIVPTRLTNRRSVDWPTDDVGTVQFHEVSYLIPSPDGSSYFTLVFTTPNLAMVEDMDFLFDTIVSTVAWVNPAA